MWVDGFALHGAQLHHGLVVRGRVFCVEQLRSQFRKLLLARRAVYGGVYGKEPREHPEDIAI